ncbi:hypothetical protein G647_09350 [Cladophialophora carrionii CBS 160.54]|uniref:Shugoshin C-terminal domain-containing protein n=1 Tax=Cladophialophora carrionii CBS 160.54 TaxID=1279043 RepID=V9CYR1_9EURO|nr:uncharacterized protein G647_09350 [Cladophialophora carrionii CBS 160.54]ETI19516.1 hypothetical protein G647_09350 [Cladophialophora carrionii CBS 160.54]
MAKLNEQPPAPPAESFDALKRRFIRQNREIARVNSTQSQRIRNLETEISRLVADNISLREQAIAAQAEAERWRAASSINNEIFDLRDRLQKKMEEVGELVGEMGRIPEKVARKGRRKSRLTNVGQRLSSATEEEWRNRLSMREATAAEGELNDGRLPAIREDKLYPRRTLENAELSVLREEAAMQQASESPELGPPPEVHFDVNEPIGMDLARTSELETGGEDAMQLPSMLERRRKRRTSALLQTMPPEEPAHEASEEPPQPQDLPVPKLGQQPLKSGAKRKLDASELDGPVIQQPQSEDDDFIFQRRQEICNSAATGTKKGSRFTRPPGRENATGVRTETQSPQKATIATRRILAPKSTNSPTKRRIHVSEKPKDGREEEAKQDAIRPVRRTNPPPQINTESLAKSADDRDGGEKDLLPKTPAGDVEGILSPLSTEPSARNPPRPKETAVLSSVEDVLNGSVGRGSRRARAAVSYAEPNLRDKMRRPGKELVGAVEGLERNKESTAGSRGASVDRSKSEDPKVNEDQCKVINIKQEKEADAESRWKDLPLRNNDDPASPLRDKERKERTNNDSKKHAEAHNVAEALVKATDRLSIFDPPVSSPMEAVEEADTDRSGHPRPSTARQKPSANSLTTRRHSVQPSSSACSAADTDSRHGPGPEGRHSTARVAPARPGSAASTRSEQMASIARDIKRSNSVNLNLKASETSSGGDAGSALSSRAERTLNRRRSMMV